MTPKHNEFFRSEVDNLLDAKSIFPTSAPWSFSVAPASKKEEVLTFCVDLRSLDEIMKADRWLLSRTEEVPDDLRGSKLITTLDLFSECWQIREATNPRKWLTSLSAVELINSRTCPLA